MQSTEFCDVGILAYNDAVFFFVYRHVLGFLLGFLFRFLSRFLLGFCIFEIFRRTGTAVVRASKKEQGRSQQIEIAIHSNPPFLLQAQTNYTKKAPPAWWSLEDIWQKSQLEKFIRTNPCWSSDHRGRGPRTRCFRERPRQWASWLQQMLHPTRNLQRFLPSGRVHGSR